MICHDIFHAYFSINCLCIFGIDFESILVSFLASFSRLWVSEFRPIFWFDILHFLFMDITPKMDPELRPNPWQGAAGQRLLSPSRSRAPISLFFEWIFIVFDPSFGLLRRQNTHQIVKDITVFPLISQPIAISDDQHIWAHVETKIITEAGPDIELCSLPASQTTCC